MKEEQKKTALSKVESIAISKNGEAFRYAPIEKINVIIVDNFPDLGKLAALRFLEWAQKNEGWSISLPTGKTPEHFIKWVSRLLREWDQPQTQKLLEQGGVDPGHKPDMKSFHFIQIDEFYPINTEQHNSFNYYVNKYYIKGFGLDPQKALLIDPNNIGLTENETSGNHLAGQYGGSGPCVSASPKRPMKPNKRKCLEAVDQFCTEYESKIRSLGGNWLFSWRYRTGWSYRV